MNRSTPGLPVHHQLPEFTQTCVLRVRNAIQPSHPLLFLLLLPPIPPSIKVFSNESTLCMRWPKYWSFSFSIIPSKQIPGLISFRMDWLDLLAVQGTTQESSPTPQFKTLVTNKTAGVFCCKIESLKIKARNLFVQIFLFLPQIGYCMLLKSRNSNNTVVIWNKKKENKK